MTTVTTETFVRRHYMTFGQWFYSIGYLIILFVANKTDTTIFAIAFFGCCAWFLIKQDDWIKVKSNTREVNK